MSSPLNNDPLAGLYVEEDEAVQPEVKQAPKAADPLADLYVDEETGKAPEEPYRDVVEEEKKRIGIPEDPFDVGDEFERAAESGRAEATRGLISGATIGISQNVPGLKPGDNVAAGTGKAIGSVLPISFLMSRYGFGSLGQLAKKSPVFQRSLSALANITGAAAAGGTYGGIEHVAKKHELPSTNEVLKHGFEWGLLDAALRATGTAGSFAVNMLKRAKKTGEPGWKIVNDVYTELKNQGVDVATDKRAGAKALSILEDMGETKLGKGETRKVTPKQFSNMDESIDKLSKPILPEAQKEAGNILNSIENSEAKALEGRIDSVGRKSVDDHALGKEIQEGIEKSLKDRRAEYKPFYDDVEKEAKFITTTPKQTAKVSGDLLPILEDLRTSPTGYGTVTKTLENVLKDAGYIIQRSKSGQIEQILQEGEIGLNKLMELGRRLNEIVEYDVLDKSVKDRLKPVVKAVKADIRSALREADPDLLASFNLAEEAHGLTAGRYGRESIYKMRGTQALEGIPKQVESATALNDLREVLEPKLMKKIERDILERMNKMNEASAEKLLRKVRAGLSKDAQQVADDIVLSKRPIVKQSAGTRSQKMHQAIDNELANSMRTGQRPSKVLELWQNPRGQKLVNEALESHPQKKELIDYLQKQTLQDMVQTIVGKEGHIDAAKLKELMSNPAIKGNLRDLGGQEAVDFFGQLPGRMENIKKNAQELVTERLGTRKGVKTHKEVPSTGERGQKTLQRMANKDYPAVVKVQKALNLLGFSGKVAFNLFSLYKFGVLKAAAIPIATSVLKKLATSNKARQAFIEASKSHKDPLVFIAAMEALGEATED